MAEQELSPAELLAAQREYAYGKPDAEYDGLLGQVGSFFRPTRQEILQPSEITYGDPRAVFNPITGRMEQEQERQFTPGQYGDPEFGLEYMPAYRALRTGVDYASDLLTDPEKRAEAAEMVKQLPEAIERQMKGSMDAYTRGVYGTRDPETGEEYRASDVLLGSTAPPALGTAIALKGVDDGVALGAGPNRIVLEGFGDMRIDLKDPPAPRFDESGSQKDLLFTHELEEEELFAALEKDGLISPSLAIARETEKAAGFGDIILVGKQEAFDPATNPQNVIFSADAYTPRHPPTFTRLLEDPEKRVATLNEDFGFLQSIADHTNSNLWYAQAGFIEDVGKHYTGKAPGLRPISYFLNEKENPLIIYKFLKDEGFDEVNNLSLRVPDRLASDTYDAELTNNALKVIDDNIDSSSDARAEIVRFLSEPLEGNPALQEKYKKWLKNFKSRYVETDEKGQPREYVEIYEDGKPKVIDATPENLVNAMRADDLRLGEGGTESTAPGPMFARTARSLPSNVAAKEYADTPEGMPRLLREKNYGAGVSPVYPEQLRSTSVTHFQEATEEILENLPIPKALRTEFLNKAAQLAPDVDAVRDYVRRSYSSLSDMADKPSLTSFILGGSRAPVNKANLEEQIEKTTQDILKFERQAQYTPKKYFEAKPQRVVSMDEFAGAIVPTYASEELIDALKAKGLKVVKYNRTADPRDEERTRASVVDAKQQFRDEMFSISGDGGLTAATLGAMEEPEEETNNNFADGGMVNSMNKFPQTGPLARQSFSRETMAPPSMDFFLPSIGTQITVPTFAQMGGGIKTGIPDFTGRVYTQDEEEVVTPTATATAQETTVPVGLNRAQQKLLDRELLQLDDLGYTKDTVKGADPTVTSVFESTTPAEDLIETTTETTTEPVIETTTEPVITTTTEPVIETTTEPVIETTTEPVIETTTEPVIETTTEPVIETTTEPLTPFETTTETTTEPVIETTTEPVIETTTEPVVDTAPLVVTEPLASEELAGTTEGEPVVLVPSPTEDDVPVFTIQEQPDAPDEQPFVPITGVSPDLSVNQYLDTTYQTGYPTTQGMEIKESLIPGQEYSAERLAAGEMIDVIKPDLGSGAELPSVDFSNIGFGTPEEEIETELYEKPEVGMTSAETMDVDAYNSYMQRPAMSAGEAVNWKTAGEGLANFVNNPLRALSDIPIKVADRIWSNRPAFILATYARDEDGNLLRNENGEYYRRDGLGTLINRILDKIDDGRSNRFFREYNEETGQLEGENWLQRLLGTQEGTDVSDKTEDGQRNFKTMLMDGLSAGLQMMNPLNLFRTPEAGQQQSTVPQRGVPSADPVVTLADGSQYSSWETVPVTLDNYNQHLQAVQDFMGPGAENAIDGLDQRIASLVGMVDDAQGTWTNMTAEQQESYIMAGLERQLQTDPYMKKLTQLGLTQRLEGIPPSQWTTELRKIADGLAEISKDVGAAYERYAEGRGVHPIWGPRMGSIDDTRSGFGYRSGSMMTPGGSYLGPGGDFFPDRISGSGRLPAAGGSWGGLNPFFEVPGPGDPMYADYLMDTMGPSKNIQNEIQAMVDRDLPFVQVTDDQGNGYLINKETGDIMFGPFPVSDTDTGGGGGTGPGGGMAEGGPVVRNVGEAEGIAGLFENMMGPGRVAETERVYKYPGGTMTERVSRGSFNLRTG